MNTTIAVYGGMFDSTSIVETVDGFPRGDKAVDAAFFAQMMRCFYSDGVIRPTDGSMAIVPGEGLTVQVSPGCAWVYGHMAWIREVVQLPVDAGHIYGICLRLHRTAGYFTLEAIEDPQNLPRREEDVWDLLLGTIEIPGGSGAITASMITDKRYDSAVCGAVMSSADSLQAVAYASDSGAVGGVTADNLLPKTGGVMTGMLRAANDGTGVSAVRNIRYGYTLPESLAEGEIFLLLSDA